MNESYRYSIDPAADSTANKLLRWAGHDAEVLELGTAVGAMSAALKAQGCRVTGIEYDAEMAAEAAPHCVRMIVADIEGLDPVEAFGAQRFGVILAADVLEHLRDPGAVLQRLHKVIAPGGRLLLSIPNIAHAGVAADLLIGRFDYRAKGLLDETHLRFFTRSSIEWLLLRAGWLPSRWDCTRVAAPATEFAANWHRLDDVQRRLLQTLPDGDVYQFILEAFPADPEGWRGALLARIEALETECGRHITDSEAAQQRIAELEPEFREYQKAFSEARAIIARFEREREALEAAQGRALAESSELREELAELYERHTRVCRERGTLLRLLARIRRLFVRRPGA